MSSLKEKISARKAWAKRRARYGDDGLSPRGEAKVAAAARRGAHKRRK